MIQNWDSSQPLPEIDNLLVEFTTFLADRKLKEKAEEYKIGKRNTDTTKQNESNQSSTIPYVEKLLTIPIEDYRKSAITLILAPYFVNVRHYSDVESFNKIKEWLLKCNDVEPLKPSLMDFNNLIKNAIKRGKETRIKPLKFHETLQYKNKKLYQLLS